MNNASLITESTEFDSIEVGLFGAIMNSTIANLHLINITINETLSPIEVGALASVSLSSIISNCSTSGVINAIAETGFSRGGGIIGFGGCISYINALFGDNIIENSRSSVNVTIRGDAGGIACSISDSIIENSFSTGNIAGGGQPSRTFVGGLVSNVYSSLIKNSFATGDVSSLGEADTGGLVGGISTVGRDKSTIINSYATGSIINNISPWGRGGFIGTDFFNHVDIYNSFWDTESSGMTVGIGEGSGGGIIYLSGLPTAQMKEAATFINSGWDFAEIWGIDTDINNGYPYLQAFHDPLAPGQVILISPDNGVDDHTVMPLFVWERPNGIVGGYNIYMGITAYPYNPIDPFFHRVATIGGSTSTSWAPQFDLEINTTYHWQIVAYNSSGLGMASQSWSFRTHGSAVDFYTQIANYETATQNVIIEVKNLTLNQLINISDRSTPGVTLTIRSANPNQPATLTRGVSGDLFSISGGYLILENIIIDGARNTNFIEGGGDLISINNNGTLEINNSEIRNNSRSGINIDGGSVTMNGGAIHGNGFEGVSMCAIHDTV